MNTKKYFSVKYNPFVEWREYKGKKIIYFEFAGLFTLKDADVALNRVAKLLFEDEDKTSLVWNCLSMRNYQEEARTLCSQMIVQQRKFIDKIYVVTDSPVIMAATEIVSFFSENNIKLETSLENFIEDFTKG